jgi:pyruvate,water dikinase
VLPAEAYRAAMDAARGRAALAAGHDEARSAPSERLPDLCDALAGRVRAAGMPGALEEHVRATWRRLGAPVVAVRSSAVGEDGTEASFAGMNASFTNVRDADELVTRIVDCWASLFGARVVAYRAARGFTGEPADRGGRPGDGARAAGRDRLHRRPRTAERGTVLIEAALGRARWWSAARSNRTRTRSPPSPGASRSTTDGPRTSSGPTTATGSG